MNITSDSRPEILFGGHDGYVYCVSPDAERLWRMDITHGRALMYASEIMTADLNQDKTPELSPADECPISWRHPRWNMPITGTRNVSVEIIIEEGRGI